MIWRFIHALNYAMSEVGAVPKIVIRYNGTHWLYVFTKNLLLIVKSVQSIMHVSVWLFVNICIYCNTLWFVTECDWLFHIFCISRLEHSVSRKLIIRFKEKVSWVEANGFITLKYSNKYMCAAFFVPSYREIIIFMCF